VPFDHIITKLVEILHRYTFSFPTAAFRGGLALSTELQPSCNAEGRRGIDSSPPGIGVSGAGAHDNRIIFAAGKYR
jgi:hypothetical protein